MTIMRHLKLSVLGLVTVVIALLGLVLVVSQGGFDAGFTLDLRVSSNAPLWEPGVHSFTAEGTGYVNSAIDREFNVSGSGTANYTIAGGGLPPGPFWASIEFAGDAKNHRLNGSFFINGEYTGTTMLESTTDGYVRTESVNDLMGRGTMSIPWEPTSHHGPLPDLFEISADQATVDFSSMGEGGKSFTIRVWGTTRITPGWSKLPVPELVSSAIAALAAVLAVGIRRCRDRTG